MMHLYSRPPFYQRAAGTLLTPLPRGWGGDLLLDRLACRCIFLTDLVENREGLARDRLPHRVALANPEEQTAHTLKREGESIVSGNWNERCTDKALGQIINE
jgi:hypothetical protein